MPFEDLTGRVIAAAIDVHKTLKPGLDEKLYERALCIEFEERGIKFKQQPKYEASYKNKAIGLLVPDLIVEDTLIVETKCVESFVPAHDAQMIGYLNITDLDIGLLLNFKVWPLGKRRIIKPGFKQPTP